MTSTQNAPVIVWFRRDLRLADHPALTAAAASGRPVLPVFVGHDAGRPAGGASRWWLHHSLVALDAAIVARGGRLVLRRGDPGRVLGELAAASGATALYCNRAVDPDAAAAEERVVAALAGRLEIRRFAGDALHPPGSVRTRGGAPFRVFTPFWRACLGRAEPAAPVAAPSRIEGCPAPLASEQLAHWGLLPGAPDWAAGLRSTWQPGEAAARRALEGFLTGGLGRYATERDRPDLPGTSRLSAHLHFGELSPRQVWHAARARAAGADSFLRQLGWREFSLHLLHAWPDLPTRPFQRAFARFPWRSDPAGLRDWQRGRTGFPLVDAGMRQLWATGWMHNRVRMAAASFLVKHLLIDWRDGEAWFWDTLVDADSANNAASWQWVAGCGADAAPYFRIFNPVLQGAKFDPRGDYVRRWLPELARVPERFVHAPWTAPPAVLEAAGVRLGRDYPVPLVEHGIARARALSALASMRGAPDLTSQPPARLPSLSS